MDNKLSEPQVMVPAREISVITGEIIEIRRQANNMLLMYVIEIGRRLIEAKRILPHGEWGKWLEEKVDFSQSTANNLMKLYEEYGQSQLSLFGAGSNSQTIGNLPYSKALQLIAIPENERESFAKEVDAEHISVKELKAAIDERNAAIKRAEEAEKKAEEIAEKQKAVEDAAAEAEKATKESVVLKEKVAELPFPYVREWQQGSDNFAYALRTGEPLVVTAEDGRRARFVLDKMYESARSGGTWVKVGL